MILGKLEGNNPAGSVKDRPAISMIQRAEERGEIKPGDTLIEATSGNTGIALAMAAAIRGYRMVLIMPEDLSVERAQTMKAFGAELILTPRSGGMEYARDLAEQMQRDRQGPRARPVRQRRQPAHPLRDHRPRAVATTPRAASRTSSVRWAPPAPSPASSRYLREKNPAVRIIGAQPSEGSRIPGIRKWPQEYLPKIYDPAAVDELVLVRQADAEEMARRLAREEGLFGGISAAGACWVALQVAEQVRERDDRVRGVRSRRPLSVDRRVPGLNMAVAAYRFCPQCATRAAAAGAGGRRRREDAPALPGLRLDALEQPDAGAGGGDRMRRPRRPACCWRATRRGAAACSR